MSSALERQCTLLIHYDGGQPDLNAIREDIESKDVQRKMSALKKAILYTINGENMPGMLMQVIRYILPHDDTHLRKMGLYFLEIVDKHGSDGKMLPEMILVCNMIRNELVHPNEYTRGCALRFCSKIQDPEILEPLVPAIRQNLEHRHSFVRRNAVLTVLSVFSKFEYLIPDASEIIESFLASEGDIACKRNAFLMLSQCDEARAVLYVHQNIQQVAGWGETLQLATLELIRKVCRKNPLEKGKYIKIIFAFLNSQSASVVYEAANTLISLSSAPTAVRAAAQCYCQLLATQSDNNVKLILLDRLAALRKLHTAVMQEMLMDIMRGLTSPNMDIKKKTLALVMNLITRRNVEDVISVLKKEVMRTQSTAEVDSAQVSEYRHLLIQSIHSITVIYPDVAPSAVLLLTDFLADDYGASSNDVVLFVREIAQIYPEMRSAVLEKVVSFLPSIRNPIVARGVLWIMGEYSSTKEELRSAISTILRSVGKMPFSLTEEATERLEALQEQAAEKTTAKKVEKTEKRPTVLADGTYATQISANDVKPATATSILAGDKMGPPLRTMILSGEFYSGVVVCCTLTKLVLRTLGISSIAAETMNKLRAEAMLVCASLLRFGRSEVCSFRIDEGSCERIVMCIRALNGEVPLGAWLDASEAAVSNMVSLKQKKDKAAEEEKKKKEAVQPEELIDFKLLRSKRVNLGTEEGQVEDIELATRTTFSASNDGVNKLNRIVQLTGMSDPIYAEAHVIVHEYDIMLDILVINRSGQNLENLVVELATMGDLKLCERPQSYNLKANEQKIIRANIKVSSTETSIIFGNIVYDVSGQMNSSGCVIMNDIHIDIMDYIKPGEVTDLEFRQMWSEFEWENKVSINFTGGDLKAYLDFLMGATNMKCLTYRGKELESGFLAANLYAKSIFGEDALMNVNAEYGADGNIVGFVRIRSKTQGIALSLGDKITMKQSQRA